MSTSNEDNLESFVITFRREIVFYLRQLVNDGERVNVIFDEGRETLLTVLLDVDEEDGILVFDRGSDENTNRRLLASAHALFVANPMGVRNQFAASRIRETSFRKQPAFAAAIPEQYVRMQRREFFRLMLPMTQRRPCTFKVAGQEKTWEMQAVDIGIGGIGLEAAAASLPFEIGQILSRVTLDLGKFGRLETDLEICYVGSVSRGARQAGRLGCHFVKLNNAQENDLQRFINHIQREERARLG